LTYDPNSRPSRIAWPNGRPAPEPGDVVGGLEVLDVIYGEVAYKLRALHIDVRCVTCGHGFRARAKTLFLRRAECIACHLQPGSRRWPRRRVAPC
jgi:hypothetical protein